MSEPVSLSYPWPDKRLSQNHRQHWRYRQKAAKTARAGAAITTCTAGKALAFLKGKPIALHVQFSPPDHRRRDLQNVIGACKALIDGIADALNRDDSDLQIHWPVEFSDAVKGGRVEVTFREGGQAE